MAAYIVANVHVKDPDTYAGYRALVPATLERYGGRFLVRGGAVERLEGVHDRARRRHRVRER